MSAPQNPKQQFVWINKSKDPRSLSSSDSQLNSKISRHAHLVSNLAQKRKGSASGAQKGLVNFKLNEPKPPGPKTPWAKDHERGKDEQDPVAISDDGGTVFLILRQDDYSLSKPVKASPVRLRNSLDSVASPVETLNFEQRSILDYVTRAWMPSADFIPTGCQLSGFSPVWPDDDKLATGIVASTLQNASERSLYALLAVGSRRMRALNKLAFAQPEAPELYSIKAIQALRKTIATSERTDDQIVMDICFLALSEFYVKSSARLEVYWRMLRDYIARCGGFPSMRLHVRHYACSIDIICSAAAVVPPALNVYKYPGILGVKPTKQDTEATIAQKVNDSLSLLDTRSQVLLRVVHGAIVTFTAVYHLPTSVVTKFKAYIQARTPLLFANITQPLWLAVQNGKPPSRSQRYVEGDTCHSELRNIATYAWLWYTAVGFLRAEYPEVESPEIPSTVQTYVSDAWVLYDTMQAYLEGTPWFVRPVMLLWTSALGHLVSKDSEHHVEYRRQFVKAAQAMSITNQQQLAVALSVYLPLDMIEPTMMTSLWTTLEEVGDGKLLSKPDTEQV